jgi:hypothetical protein
VKPFFKGEEKNDLFVIEGVVLLPIGLIMIRKYRIIR